MTSATEVLRSLLDERGVEYMKVDFLDGEHITSFDVNGREYGYHEFPDGGTLLRVWHPTPEQAIAATLGAGTCRMELPDLRGPAFTDVYVCSECGGEVMVGTVMGESDVPKWCPWCGRKVVSE